MSEASYWSTINAIALEILEEYGPDDDNWRDAISERVDGNSFIIYYSNNEIVLNESPNEPDGDEVRAMCKKDADWREMRMAAAYMAMEADVYEKCRELGEELGDSLEEVDLSDERVLALLQASQDGDKDALVLLGDVLEEHGSDNTLLLRACRQQAQWILEILTSKV